MKRLTTVVVGWLMVMAYVSVVCAQFDLGACCFDDGSCIDLILTDCVSQGGNPQIGILCFMANCPTPEQDWGDAPDPTYPTYAANGGAVHTIMPGMKLGGLIDFESDGLPDADATGDDLDNIKDEDGISFATALVPGSNAVVTVTTVGGGKLDAWIDFDQNGNWEDPSERLFGGSLSVPNGTTNVTFSVPGAAPPGPTFGRFRLSTSGGLPPTGPADDGEVEDHKVTVGWIDWGDAPDPAYPTLLAGDGARHIIRASLRLGSLIDAEVDGQPNTPATGDDVNGTADEDGLTALSPLRPGQTASMSVTSTGSGQLDAWIDFDGNGTWEHPAEHIFGGSSVALSSGSNPGLGFSVPAAAFPGASYLRLRVSGNGGLTPRGLALDGEVEDYQVNIEGLDWGDAPDPGYPTLTSSAGAWHVIRPGYRMGIFVDHETDGQPTSPADGDDLGGFDDEDGVRFLSPFIPGRPTTIEITGGASNSFVDGWVDYDRDGSWENAEHINYGTSIPLSSFLTTNINAQVPLRTSEGVTYARFRVSSGGNLGPTGFAADGEVEDYTLMVMGLDWGDAPDDPYPTLGVSDGPRHLPDGETYLGGLLDTESDGLEDFQARGDDLDHADDEDGVSLTALMIPGQTSHVAMVVGPGGGVVDAWIDFDQSGSWTAGERIFGSSGLALSSGLHTGIPFLVPASAKAGATFARFRISTSGGLAATGYAPDGEVEDYEVEVEALDWGDAPDPAYPTLRASSGAQHVVTPTVLLGALIDGESDGQPGSAAQGDDEAGIDDEDGISFSSLIVPGRQACIEAVAGESGGELDAWIDFNGNGTWDHPAEHLFGSSVSLSSGSNPGLCFAVPADAVPGTTMARFRLSLSGGLTPTGFAPDGEVEDHAADIVVFDWGDAPDPTYATLMTNNGPSHIVRNGYLLGTAIDQEVDGQPHSGALGDDLNGVNDEDGVFFPSPIVRGGLNCITVIAGSSGGILNAWVDFDADGSFDHPAERLFSGPGWSLTPGVNTDVCFDVPGDAVLGATFARFRLSSAGGLAPTGQAPEGEVEDYDGVLILQPHPQSAVVITSVATTAGAAIVSWNAESNVLYQLQATTNIVMDPDPAWMNVGSPVLGPAHQQADPLAGQPDKVYRVAVPLVP